MRKLLATLLLALPTLAMAQQAAVVSQTDAAAPASDGSASCPANYAAIIVIRDGARINQHLCCKDKGGGSWKWERCDAGLGGTGTVTGPASSTDNAIVRWDGTTGTKIDQATSDTPTISDTGVLSLATTGGLDLPETSSSTDGRISWDATNDDLKVGTGASTQTLVAAPSSSTANAVPFYADTTGTSLSGAISPKIASSTTDYLVSGDLVYSGNFQGIVWEGQTFPASANSQSIQGGILGTNEGMSMGLALMTHLHYDNSEGWRFVNRGDKGWRLFGARPVTTGKTESTINGFNNNTLAWCAGAYSDPAMAGGFTDLYSAAQIRDQQGLCLLGGYRNGTGGLLFEGETYNDHEGVVTSADVTDDREWTLPDLSGTVAMVSQTAAGNATPLTWNVTPATCTGDGNAGTLTVNGSNQIICSVDDGGGGGTPGGLNTEIQYNNSGSFGGVPKITYNGTNLTIDAGSNSTLTLPQGETPGNTTEGVIQWDTNDNKMSIGDGAAALKFWPINESGSTNAYLCTATKTADASPDSIVCATDPSSLGGGSGDVSAVGNCTGGECFDGTVDGGTSLTFYDSVSPRSISYAETGTLFSINGNVRLTGGDRVISGGSDGGSFTLRSLTTDEVAQETAGITFEYKPDAPLAVNEVACPFMWYSELDDEFWPVAQFCTSDGWKFLDFETGLFGSLLTSQLVPASACLDGQTLTWDGTFFTCSSTPLVDIEEQETTRVTDAERIDFAGVDFAVVADGKEANISIGASITRDAEWDTSAEIRTNLDEGDSSYTGTGDLVFADAPTFANSTVQFGTNPGPNPVQTHFTAMQVPQYGRMAWEIPFVSNVTGPTEFSFATAWATFNGIRDNNFGKYYNVYPGMGKINNNTYGVGDYWEMDGAVDCPVPPGPACPKFEWNMDFVPEPEHVSNEAWRYWYFVLDPALRSGDGAVQTFAFNTHRLSDNAWLIQDDTTTGATGAKVDFNYSATSVTGAGKTRAHYGNFAGTQQGSAYAFSASRIDRGTGTTSHAEEYGGIQSIIELGSATSTHDYGYARGNRTEINAIGTATSQTSEEVVGFSTKVTVNPSGLCSGGSNNGNYCDDSSDCPGGTCPASSHNYDDVYGLNVEWGTIRDEASIITRSAGVRVGDWPTAAATKQADFRYGLWVGDQKCDDTYGGECDALRIEGQTNGDGAQGNLALGGGQSTDGHLTFRSGQVHLWLQDYDGTYMPNDKSGFRKTQGFGASAVAARGGDLFQTSGILTLAAASSITVDDGSHAVALSTTSTINTIQFCDSSNAGKRLVIFCGSTTTTVNDNGVSAGNVKLKGNVNFVCSTDDALSLVCDGTNWVETSRSAVAGDSVRVEAGDNGGTFDAVDTTADFEDSGDINFTIADGGAGGPDAVSATIRPGTVDGAELANSITLDANTTISTGAYSFQVTVSNPSSPGVAVEGTGNFGGDLLHVHQNTGNPTAGNLIHAEAADADITPLVHIDALSPSTTATADAIVGLLIDTDDNNDTSFLPILVQDNNAGTPDTLMKLDYTGKLTLAGNVVVGAKTDASVSTAGEIAVDTSGNQGEQLLFHDGGALEPTNVLDPLRSVCAMVPDITSSDVNFEFWMAPFPVTLVASGCHCQGASCGTVATFGLEDRSGNAITVSMTCTTNTTSTSYAVIDTGDTDRLLETGEGLRFDVTNTPTTGNKYTLCVRYKVDAR